MPNTHSDHPVGIDLPGTVLFAATLTALLIPLTEGHSLRLPSMSRGLAIMFAFSIGFGAFMFALGVATLGTLYLTRAAHNPAHAFATVEGVQMCIVALLAIGAAALPRCTAAAADTPVIDA